jgi:hypothetical protein
MIQQRRKQNAENDGQRPLKSCRQNERKKLRLIADFGEGDDAG